MATEWFLNDGSGISVSVDDPRMVLLDTSPPDWVEVPPESPMRGGERLRVLGWKRATCPMCREAEVRHLLLEHEFCVAQCKPGCGFVFYKPSGKTSPEQP
jgi:hypothetical protein